MQVSLKNITKIFDGKVSAVDDFSVEVHSGKLFFLLGPSGCGKTTLLRMIAGFETPTRGDIYFDDTCVTHLKPQKRGIGMVFQNYALWPHLSVQKNIEYGLNIRKLSSGEKRKRIDEVLDIVQMPGYEDRLPNQLSGGQQQRIALARALVIRPKLLLFDEPLSNLDTQLRLELRDEIKRIHDQTKITTIYVTHDQKEALSMADFIVVMNKGKLIQMGKPVELYRYPLNRFIAGFIGETNFIQATIDEIHTDKTIVSTSLGRFETPWTADSNVKGKTVILSIRPESIRVGLDPLSTPNSFEVDIKRVVYLGEVEQFELHTQDAHNLRAWRFNPEDQHGLGKTIASVKPRDIIVLEKEISQ